MIDPNGLEINENSTGLNRSNKRLQKKLGKKPIPENKEKAP